jgi:hypothetical protein
MLQETAFIRWTDTSPRTAWVGSGGSVLVTVWKAIRDPVASFFVELCRIEIQLYHTRIVIETTSKAFPLIDLYFDDHFVAACWFQAWVRFVLSLPCRGA